jgi:L-threonine kinase
VVVPVLDARTAAAAPPAPPETGRAGHGSAPGTCGELVQGVLGHRDFLITLPVDLRVQCTVTPSPAPGVTVWPPHKTKVARSAREAARRLGLRLDTAAGPGIRIDVASPIPEGKGLASSSADIVAACRAMADYAGEPLTEAEIAEIACGIEPSDAVMYDHPVVFEFFAGRVLHDPGRRLPVLAVAVDTGGSVETQGFRRVPYTAPERRVLARAYDLAVAGLERGEIADVGEAATLSARVNQARHRKPHLERLIALAAQHGGAGVCVAHSGTIAAVLFAPDRGEAARRAALHAADLLPGAAAVSVLNGR